MVLARFPKDIDLPDCTRNFPKDVICNTMFILASMPILHCVVRFGVSTAVTMKNGVFWDDSCVALVRTDVSEELNSPPVFFRSVRRLLVTANVPSSPILVTLTM
jgi:hypothetical protein